MALPAKIIGLIALLLLIVLSTTAKPIASIDINSTISTEFAGLARFSKRECVLNPATPRWECDDNMPTIEQIVRRIRDTQNGGQADAEHVAVFYSGLDDPDLLKGEKQAELSWMVGWLKARNIKYYWWFEHISRDWFQVQLAHVRANAAQNQVRWGDAIFEFYHCEFQAISAAAINPVAYVFTPKGLAWSVTSSWERAEYWALTRNPNIKKIYRVDPRPWNVVGITEAEFCEHSKEELLWDRDRGDAEFDGPWKCSW